MSTTTAAAVSIVALAALGVLPVLATTGWRWVSVPLAPIAGAIATALGGGAFLLFGGTFLLWTIAIATVAGLVVLGRWWRNPACRPRRPTTPPPTSERVLMGIGLLGSIGAACWSLRALATPTVGFDTRAVWALRDGWLLHDHAQALLDFKVHMFLIGQSGYPPLVSTESTIGWALTGVHTIRLAVVIVAIVNAAAVLCLSCGLLEVGRAVSRRSNRLPALLALGGGAIAATAIVLIAFGIQEPFITNGYADPLWAACAAGAVVFGLQLDDRPAWRAAAGILVVAAGMTKQEGLFTAVGLIVLMTARRLGGRTDRRRQATVVGAAVVELASLAWWWLAIHLTGSRDVTSPLASTRQMPHRAVAVFHGFSPSLHVLVLALGVSLLGGLALRTPRRRAGLGNDLWAWAGLLAGLGVVSLVLVTGQAPVLPWIAGSVHRVTQYPAITGWLLVSVWGLTAIGGLDDAEPLDVVGQDRALR